MNSHPNTNQSSSEIGPHSSPTSGTDSLPRLTLSQIGAWPSAPSQDLSATERLSDWYASATEQVSPKTAAVYRRTYFRLVDRAAAERDVDPDFVATADLIELLQTDTTIKLGTKGTYKAAIIWALNQPDFGFSPEMRDHGLKLARAFDPRESAEQEILRNTRPSARSIPEKDLGILLNGLLSARSSQQSWAAKTTSWLNAGVATGARPGEWEFAYWLDRDRRILRLPNSKLKKQAPFTWQHIPERLLNRADADLASMAEEDLENISAVVAAAKRHSDALARNLAFFDQVEASTDESNAEAIETLRRLRAWELHNAGLAWRDIEVPVRWVGAVDAHLTNLQQYLSGAPTRAGEPTFERYYGGCRVALHKACRRAFPDGRLYSLYDTRSTAAANMQATIGAEAAAAVMGHYMKRKRTIKANYAAADRAYRGAGRFAPSLADTQNQRDQAADRSAAQSPPAEAGGSGDAPSASAPDAPATE